MRKVFLFTLSTCSSCRRLKEFLRRHNVPFDYTDLDRLRGMNYQSQRERAHKLSGSFSIPVVVIGDETRVGFDPEWLARRLGLREIHEETSPAHADWKEDPLLVPRRETLRMMFGPSAAALGYRFTPDVKEAGFLLEQVARNERRYGMPFCPCRMVSGNRKEDLRAICPCIPYHREHFNRMRRCWCGLFVHSDVEDVSVLKQIPEEEME